MNEHLNFDLIEVVALLLKEIPPESRLLALQNLCINNGGTWDYSISQPYLAQPCLFEIRVLGVPAMADDRDRLAENWLRAASNILSAEQGAAA